MIHPSGGVRILFKVIGVLLMYVIKCVHVFLLFFKDFLIGELTKIHDPTLKHFLYVLPSTLVEKPLHEAFYHSFINVFISLLNYSQYISLHFSSKGKSHVSKHFLVDSDPILEIQGKYVKILSFNLEQAFSSQLLSYLPSLWSCI